MFATAENWSKSLVFANTAYLIALNPNKYINSIHIIKPIIEESAKTESIKEANIETKSKQKKSQSFSYFTLLSPLLVGFFSYLVGLTIKTIYVKYFYREEKLL